jgi:hypothetical protein
MIVRVRMRARLFTAVMSVVDTARTLGVWTFRLSADTLLRSWEQNIVYNCDVVRMQTATNGVI